MPNRCEYSICHASRLAIDVALFLHAAREIDSNNIHIFGIFCDFAALAMLVRYRLSCFVLTDRMVARKHAVADPYRSGSTRHTTMSGNNLCGAYGIGYGIGMGHSETWRRSTVPVHCVFHLRNPHHAVSRMRSGRYDA